MFFSLFQPLLVMLDVVLGPTEADWKKSKEVPESPLLSDVPVWNAKKADASFFLIHFFVRSDA
jgi:hypothetical protein